MHTYVSVYAYGLIVDHDIVRDDHSTEKGTLAVVKIFYDIYVCIPSIMISMNKLSISRQSYIPR